MAAPAPLTSERPRIFPPIPARVFVMLGLYLATCWAIVIQLAAGAIPYAPLVLGSLAMFTTVPLVLFLVRGGFGRAPGRAYRLWVMRPFWYVQLTLPLVAIAGIVGITIGLPFGSALASGRILAGGVAVLLATLLLAGYVGSRRL
ncbi:MAG: metallophosphoesterase, partial [Gemmatimonadetes bacterium]|nr:metallophosphoesterase [Gemmatimonadota bacterium]